jgi:hypothetical protein
MKPPSLPLFLLCAAASFGSVQAAPVLSLSQASCAPGQTAVLELSISGSSSTYGGCSATLRFPPKIQPTQIAPGSLLSGGDAEIYWQLRPQPDGVTLLTLVAGAGSNSFSGASGTLLAIKVETSGDVASGTYPIAFGENTNALLACARHAISSADGRTSVSHSVAAGSLLVTALPAQDANLNGIPDDWEIRYFGSVTNVSTATDADADGLNDYYEFLSGTNPRDPLSCVALRITSSTLPSFRWYSATNATYDVYRATNLHDAFAPLATNLPSTLPQNTFTDISATGHIYFYNVRKH